MISVPDDNKMNFTINGVTQIFGFLVHIKTSYIGGPMQGAKVWSLGGKLKFYMLCVQSKICLIKIHVYIYIYIYVYIYIYALPYANITLSGI